MKERPSMIKIIHLAAGLMLLLIAAPVLGSNVKTEYKRTVDPGTLKRFTFRAPTTNDSRALATAVKDLAPEIPTTGVRLREALVAELDARNFQFVPEGYADFTVICQTSEDAARDETTTNSGNGMGGVFHYLTAGLVGRQHERGWVVVEVFDRGNQLIWRGRFDGTVKADISGHELDPMRSLVDRFLKDIQQKAY